MNGPLSSRPRTPGAEDPIAGSLASKWLARWRALAEQHMAPGLYVVATPIGHAADLSLRALHTLATVDAIACEDTRVTRKLLALYGLSRPLVACHDHNAATVAAKVIARVQAGARIALVTDAGTPLVSDPGYRLVADAIAAGVAVIPIPGASAVLAALAVAGLPTDRFLFAGFPPSRAAARRRWLAELAAVPATLVLMEAPHRLAASLADMAQAFGSRPAAVGRELTKLFEDVRRGRLDDLAGRFAADGPVRGEVTIVVAPPPADLASTAPDIDALLRIAMAEGSVKSAAASVAAATGEPRSVVYARALALKQESR